MNQLQKIAVSLITLIIIIVLLLVGVTVVANSSFIEEGSFMQNKYEEFERWKDDFELSWPWEGSDDATSESTGESTETTGDTTVTE